MALLSKLCVTAIKRYLEPIMTCMTSDLITSTQKLWRQLPAESIKQFFTGSPVLWKLNK